MTPAAGDKGAAANPRLAKISPVSAPKSPATGEKLHCWMAEKGAWLFKSQANGSWTAGLRKPPKVYPFLSKSQSLRELA